MRFIQNISFCFLLLICFSACDYSPVEIPKTEKWDSLVQDSIELCHYLKNAHLSVYPEEYYNAEIADVESLKNINRPSKSYVLKPKFDTNCLYHVWGGFNDEPVSDFRIDKEFIDIAEYDGNANMPYIWIKDSLYIFYNDFVRKGKIIKLNNDTLMIAWHKWDSIISQYKSW